MTSKRTKYIKHVRYVSFGIGAALGSALGLLLGSLLTYWLGEGTVRMIQRGLRRMSGDDNHPNFEMLAQ
jgi:membrane protein YqaA with SNARE-associated domain